MSARRFAPSGRDRGPGGGLCRGPGRGLCRVAGHAAGPGVALTVLSVLVLAGCAGSPTALGTPTAPVSTGGAVPTTTTSAAPTTTTSAAPTTTPATPTVSPPTGPTLTPLTGGPVLAVKVDNTGSSRPRVGLNQADVVYVEPVEGGLTRLLAIFSTAQATQVGPVRSARESDVALLANYGVVAFAFSGASAGTLAMVGAGAQKNLVFDASRQGFRRDGGRPAPYDVIGSPSALLARAGGSAPPADVGFRFGPASAGAVAGTRVLTRWPASGIEMAWDPARGRYLVTTDGRPDIDADGTQHGAATVIVQMVSSHLSQNRDVNGAQTPVVDVIGQGPVTVLRDGQAWSGQWSRPTAAAPTSFAANGAAVAMAPGPVWVLLVPQGQPVAIG